MTSAAIQSHQDSSLLRACPQVASNDNTVVIASVSRTVESVTANWRNVGIRSVRYSRPRHSRVMSVLFMPGRVGGSRGSWWRPGRGGVQAAVMLACLAVLEDPDGEQLVAAGRSGCGRQGASGASCEVRGVGGR